MQLPSYQTSYVGKWLILENYKQVINNENFRFHSAAKHNKTILRSKW